MSPIDLEKGDTMAPTRHCKAPILTTEAMLQKCRTWPTNLSTMTPLAIAYLGLYLTNYYLSPSGPGSHHSDGDKGRIQPLVINLMLLAPDAIRKAFAVTTFSATDEAPCFSFGWLAYSMTLLFEVVSGSGVVVRGSEEFGVNVVDLNVGMERRSRGRKMRNGGFAVWKLLKDLHSREKDDTAASDCKTVVEILEPAGPVLLPHRFLATRTQNCSLVTGLLQFCLAGLFWWYYSDLSVLLLLSTAILLVEATTNLPVLPSQKPVSRSGAAVAVMRDTGGSPERIYIILPSPSHPHSVNATPPGNDMHTTSIPASILITGAFLSLALLFTQISDAASVALLTLMFCGTISNVALAALPGVPRVGGAELRSVGVVRSEKGVLVALREVERGYEGYGGVLVRECFPHRLEEWEGGKGKELEEMD
jgi:hypothetical protein